ncbi:MAG: SDR family NAD(P)-dependent oxidoreductase [Brevinematia bacterium]
MNDNKVVIVTGGTSGIGKATAKILSENNYIVYACGRDLSKARDLEKMNTYLEFLDLENEKTIEDLVNKVIDSYGRIDVLVNNAGYGIAGSVEDIPIEEARRQFEVNLFSQLRLSRMVIPIMRKQGRGRIINVTSVASLIPSPILSWYSASKVAFSFMSFALRQEVKKFGIDVVEIAPSGINTNWPVVALSYLEKFSQNSMYSDLSEKVFRFFESSIRHSPSPEVVAKKILKIINKNRTKPRYFVPSYASFFNVFVKLFPQSFWDKFYTMLIK